MALGGGTFTAMNKKIPGTYINFVSRGAGFDGDYERGVACLPMAMPYGPEGEFVTVDASDLLDTAKVRKLFGYSIDAEGMLSVREVFRHARKVLFYRLDTGGTKASCAIATAKYTGNGGNSFTIEVEADPDMEEGFIVTTVAAGKILDKQTNISSAGSLVSNDYVDFDWSATLEAGVYPLYGGVTGSVTVASWTTFLSAAEAQNFDVLGVMTDDSTAKGLVAAFVKRMRDERGQKFQAVMHNMYADHEGIINMIDQLELVPWLTGAQAGCRLSESLTNAVYDGELEPSIWRTQTEMEQSIGSGAFMFHKVGDDLRVLQDVNSFISVTNEKNRLFSRNDVVRTIDALAMNEASIFATRYLGLKNNAANRGALWTDIVKLHRDLQDLGAIIDFTEADITIAEGESKEDVVINSSIVVTVAMEKLYITTYIG